MSIPVTCPQCGANNKVNERFAGRRVRCPKCDTAVHVPELDVDRSRTPLSGAATTEQPGQPGQPAQPESRVPVAEPAQPARAVPAPQAPATGAASEPVTAAEATPSAPGGPAAAFGGDDDADDEFLQEFKRKKRDEEELDMTPMVDVTFLLLIFFMVTAAFSLQKSIEMPRQQTDAPSTTVVEQEEEDLEMVEVQVDEYGAFLVLAADWQEETPGKQNLITALKRARAGANARLVIKVHELCKLQYLVDAMDAGTIAGYTETQVTQVENF